MAVRDAAYIELYARDKLSTVDYFVSALGFTRVADSVGVDRSSVLLRGNGARLLVTSGPAGWKFLDEHGDGIGDIAVTCDDVAETLDAAVVAGARMVGTMQGNPMVTGFGGVVHTLLPHAGDLGSGLPPGRSWAACAPGGLTAQAGPVRTLDQVEICLERGSVAGYADFYHDAFGFHRSASDNDTDGDGVRDSMVIRSRSERITFALVAPDPLRSPGELDAFLARNGGPGVRRLVFSADRHDPVAHAFEGRAVAYGTVGE